MTGTSAEAVNAQRLLSDIGFNVAARVNKMMLFISEAARDSVLAASEAVQNVFSNAGFGMGTDDTSKGMLKSNKTCVFRVESKSAF